MVKLKDRYKTRFIATLLLAVGTQACIGHVEQKPRPIEISAAELQTYMDTARAIHASFPDFFHPQTYQARVNTQSGQPETNSATPGASTQPQQPTVLPLAALARANSSLAPHYAGAEKIAQARGFADLQAFRELHTRVLTAHEAVKRESASAPAWSANLNQLIEKNRLKPEDARLIHESRERHTPADSGPGLIAPPLSVDTRLLLEEKRKKLDELYGRILSYP